MNKIILSPTVKDNDIPTMGQFWLNTEKDMVYFLACVGKKYVLINLATGCFWRPLEEAEKEVFGCDKYLFRLIKEPFTIYPNESR